MEQFPTELRRSVIQYLDLSSLKSLRLTSRAWAALGEEYLISSDFNALPYRPDTERLMKLSKHPKFSFRIQSICFNHGEVDEYQARHNTFFLSYMQEAESRLQSQSGAWLVYGNLRKEIEQYLPRSCELEVLTEIFGSLPNLRTIEVTLMTCPFKEENHPELLGQIWALPTTRLMPRVATTQRFTDILTALSSNLSVISVKSLSHDRLPFEFFAQKAIVISLLSTAFQSLTNLSLAIDYSDMPNNLHCSLAFQNLSQCIRAATSLKTLEVAFQGRKKIDISPLLFSLQEIDHIFPSLEELAFEGILTTETGFGDFVTKQRCLKRLQIGGEGIKPRYQQANGGVHLREGSFRGLFRRVRAEMALESFTIQGDLVGLESGERWVLNDAVDEMSLWEYVTD